MQALITRYRYIMKTPAIILTALFTIVKVDLLPNFSLLEWLGIAIAVDLITGLGKSVFNGKEITSYGLQKTVKKTCLYLGAILLSIIFLHVKELLGYGKSFAIAPYLNDGLVAFLIYIEMISVLENLIAFGSDDILTNYVFKPLHRILTVKLSKNLINKLGGADKGAKDNDK